MAIAYQSGGRSRRYLRRGGQPPGTQQRERLEFGNDLWRCFTGPTRTTFLYAAAVYDYVIHHVAGYDEHDVYLASYHFAHNLIYGGTHHHDDGSACHHYDDATAGVRGTDHDYDRRYLHGVLPVD